MQKLLRAGAFALALFGCASLAAAQGAPGSGNAPDQLQPSPSQKQSIRQGLMDEQTQTTVGSQGQVGSKTPASVTPHALPSDVFFVKLLDLRAQAIELIVPRSGPPVSCGISCNALRRDGDGGLNTGFPGPSIPRS